MTGLHPADDVIIEVAVLITDKDLKIVAKGPCLAVHRSDEVLARMDDWCQRTHGGSGLTERVRSSTVSMEQAADEVLDFVRLWVPQGASPLCGNSIAHDRRFVRREMPGLEDWLHYRNVDVSTIKELVRRWYPDTVRAPDKQGHHLALDDIVESIEELRWYREHVFVSSGD